MTPTRRYLNHSQPPPFDPSTTDTAILIGLALGGMVAGAIRYLPGHVLRWVRYRVGS